LEAVVQAAGDGLVAVPQSLALEYQDKETLAELVLVMIALAVVVVLELLEF